MPSAAHPRTVPNRCPPPPNRAHLGRTPLTPKGRILRGLVRPESPLSEHRETFVIDRSSVQVRSSAPVFQSLRRRDPSARHGQDSSYVRGFGPHIRDARCPCRVGWRRAIVPPPASHGRAGVPGGGEGREKRGYGLLRSRVFSAFSPSARQLASVPRSHRPAFGQGPVHTHHDLHPPRKPEEPLMLTDYGDAKEMFRIS